MGAPRKWTWFYVRLDTEPVSSMTAGIGFVEMGFWVCVNAGYQATIHGGKHHQGANGLLSSPAGGAGQRLPGRVVGGSQRAMASAADDNQSTTIRGTSEEHAGWDNLERYAHQIGIAAFDVNANTITASDMLCCFAGKCTAVSCYDQDDTGLAAVLHAEHKQRTFDSRRPFRQEPLCITNTAISTTTSMTWRS